MSATDAPALAELGEAARAKALLRWSVLRPHIEDGVALVHAARDAGVPERTAQRWLARYRDGGLVGLAAAPRSDRGRRRMPDQLVGAIEGIALRSPRPSAATVHRRALQVAERHGWAAPSYATVHAIVRALDPAMVTLAHDGDKRYRETFDLIHRREAERANDIWQADHTELDLWVIDSSGQPARPWLTITAGRSPATPSASTCRRR